MNDKEEEEKWTRESGVYNEAYKIPITGNTTKRKLRRRISGKKEDEDCKSESGRKKAMRQILSHFNFR